MDGHAQKLQSTYQFLEEMGSIRAERVFEGICEL